MIAERQLADAKPSSPASSMDTEMFHVLESLSQQICPGTVTLPWMSTGGSDNEAIRLRPSEPWQPAQRYSNPFFLASMFAFRSGVLNTAGSLGFFPLAPIA